MPDAETSLLTKIVGDLEDSLESNVASAVTEPIVGWVCSFLGYGGGGDDTAPEPEAILQKLSDLQNDFSTLLGAVNKLGPQIGNFISTASAVDRMQPAVSAVQSYELTKNPLADATFTTNLNYLNTVHDALTTGTAYLTTFLNSNVSYYADNSSIQQMINGFFLYYQNLQAVLMQMAIEAAHQGQPVPPPSNPPLPPAFPAGTDVFAPMPPNYQGAAEAYALYTGNIAEQKTYLPFPTTGVGSLLPSPSSAGGPRQIVFDRNTGIAWSSTNYSSSVAWLQQAIFSTVPAIQDALKVPNAWMVRLPTYDEIHAFRASFPLPSNVVLGLEDIVNAMSQFGFNLGLQQLGAGNSNIGYPFVTSDVLKSANWTFLNLKTVQHGGGGRGSLTIPVTYSQVADGYKCTWFYDLVNGVGIEVDIYCPVTGLTPSQTAPTDGLFADIRNATAIALTSSLGSVGAAAQLSTSAYADAIFIYQLANADSATNVNTDPPVEEPSSIQITSVPSADGMTVQFSATGTFIRFDRYAGNTPVQINIADVFWASSDSDVATINQSGLLTWKVNNGSVSVTATRGPLTSQPTTVTGPSIVPTPNLIPLEVNIYPRGVTILRTALPTEATFYGQILWSDGSTSTFGDGVNTTTPANDEASAVIPPFNYTFAEATGNLSLDSGQQSTFAIQSGQIGPFQINVTVTLNENSQQWTDHAALKTK